MKKITDKDFTFGFELEGIFKNSLVDKVYTFNNNIEVELKDDGSVHADFTGVDDIASDDNGEWDTEINVGIFKNLPEMISCMALFKNGKNYFSNESCGLHIHIKPKRGEDLKMIIFDRKFIIKLQRYAELLCPETRVRIIDKNKGEWCRCFYSGDRLLSDFKNKRKYVFMGNHPQGTIEFRFFSACEHKVENVKRFFDYFFGELNKIKSGADIRVGLKSVVELEWRPFYETIYPIEKKIEEKFDLKYNKKLKICV